MLLRGQRSKIKRHLVRFAKSLVDWGAPPSWFGYRWVRSESLRQYLKRRAHSGDQVQSEIIHPETVANNPLPCNIASRDNLPKDRGWWGYSFWDVPARTSGPTVEATLLEASIVPYTDPQGEFWVGVMNADGRALDIREFHFRAGHAAVMRSSRPAQTPRATWVIERVYHNYSHWLTAHLPKLLLLKARGTLGDVLLPPERPAFVDDSLRLFGMDPSAFQTFDPTRPLNVAELTVMETDRFRPELLQLVRQNLPGRGPESVHRRVFVSRSKCERRKLVNEAAVWPLLERAGFERVYMEDLDFDEQVALMRETAVLFAPHGAGLTNMLFCPPGTHVVEVADLSFPNPNFYAVASAMGHHYWLLSADGIGDVHPLEKDLEVDPEAVEALLETLP